MRCVSFGYAGKKLLIPLVTVFIVIVSCCVSPSAFYSAVIQVCPLTFVGKGSILFLLVPGRERSFFFK